ncbi:secreted PhoX family phosphatase [Acinetobacter baylyi]|uniref:Secreted PhoX family phosphatase n=1 Tax=Acinetobacter baylyi TaxID=202950 RepID=A0ABU0UYQ1_ACIBI|nr:alkaline phosphatase PhoX [Acinetobacter baylyi]MDQ1209694.1 secreted PhoX family phosphatase [Acinetobacter baylyi]MDR6106710.1 secreted PhoX family phosphatase [Acinetobacter baylyi]MDR6186564.1 secreted PhoX family phosphatase [Acinetobacter baylyi]
MTTTSANQHPTRRDLLKWFTGIPFLPLGAMATAATLAGCNDSDTSTTPTKTVNFKSATFTSMDAPTLSNPAAMATTTVNSKLSVNWDDGSKTDYQLAYKPFFKTGDSVPNLSGGTIIAGGYVDAKGNPIVDKSIPGSERQFFSDCPDGSSLITVPNANVAGVNNPVFHVVQFEYTTKDLAGKSMYGKLPSPIAVLTLDQDQKTGHLELKKYYNVDMSSAHGLWITCGASMSPWGTHLSSEEYEPDAFDQGVGTALSTVTAYSQNYFGDTTTANPYNYGHLPEVTVHADGTGSVKKHFCVGRISHELVQVMPDNRTLIMGDDYTNGGFFMFVADKEKDLSAGTLYVAKYTAVFSENTIAPIQWINLGHATSQEISDLVNVSKIKPTDIMESLSTQPADTTGYTQITLNTKTLWVKVKSGMEKAAAFLETHRYAALKGGSMAFTKLEGTTVNIKDKVAYSAVSYLQKSMVKNGSGWVESNNVSFSKAINAGAVVAHDMKGGQIDSTGATINSDWVAYQSRVLIAGEDLAASDTLGNTANPDKIANPDNLKYSEALRTLFIGEDSGMHVNNFLWAYNVDTKVLSRILSTPAGAESTGLHAVDSINGWTYIMSNFQHAGDWESIHSNVKGTLQSYINANYNNGYAAAVGYLTADPIAPSMVKKSS